MTSDLQDILQTEFPFIDSSLLAALLLDYQESNQADSFSLQSLRDTLTQLSLGVQGHDVEPLRTPSSNSPGNDIDTQTSSSSSKLDPTSSKNNGDSQGTQDDVSISESMSGSVTSISMTSMSSNGTSFSPVEFLSVLFPNLSPETINQVFQEHYGSEVCTLDIEHEVEDFDLSAVVDHLLSLEYIQDLTERGLDDEEHQNDNEWKVVNHNAKHNLNLARSPPKKPKKPPNKIAFVDIRQRQHRPMNQPSKNAVKPGSRSFTADPWIRLSSIAARLSELLQPAPPGFFLSYFHAPQSTVANSKAGWKMEGDALRNALSDLIRRRKSPTIIDASTLQASVSTLRDIIVAPGSDDTLPLDSEQLLELERDAKLSILAARGNLDIALDLLWLLRELDEAFVNGVGVAHLQVYTNGNDNTQSSPTTTVYPSNAISTPNRPPPTPPPLSIKPRPPDASKSKNSSWTTVQRRSRNPISPHVDFIPAYSNGNHRLKLPVRGSGNRFGKGGKGDVGELDHDLMWYRDQRKEALHAASRSWKSGSTKNRGGEVAFYYAEKARGFQEQEHAKALEMARMAVNEKRLRSQEKDTLDLHGLTVSEARVIVKEAVQAFDPSNTRPFKIITGRGRHSIDCVSVLGPAVKEMLEHEGYKISTWDAGLIVRGR